MPVVFSDNFTIPGCKDIVSLGINSKDSTTLYSDQCLYVSERTMKCDCIDSTIKIYSKDLEQVYDLIFEYSEQDTSRRIRFDDYKFTEFYNNSLLNIVISGLMILFIGAIIVPSLCIFLLTSNHKNGKHK